MVRSAAAVFLGTDQAAPGLVPLGLWQHSRRHRHGAADQTVGLKPESPHAAAPAPSPAASSYLPLWL